MVTDNILYNKSMQVLADENIQSQLYDREFCDMSDTTLRLSLLNKVNSHCLSKEDSQKLYSLILKEFNLHAKKCVGGCTPLALTSASASGLTTIVKDETLEYYQNNPDCCPLELRLIIQNQMEFNFNVITSIDTGKDKQL